MGNVKASQLNGYPNDPTLFLAGQEEADGSNKWLPPSGSGVFPVSFPNVPGEFLDSYDDATGLFTASTPSSGGGGGLFGGGGGTLVPPPSQSTLTQVNFTGASLTDVGNTMFLTRAPHTGDFVSYAYKAYPGGNFTFTIGVVCNIAAANFFSTGICISDGTKIMVFAPRYGNGYNVVVDEYNTTTSFGANVAIWFQDLTGKLVFLTVENDGTNLNFYVDFDLSNLKSGQRIFQIGKTSYQTPTQMGIGAAANNASIAGNVTMTIAHWNGF